MMRFQRVSLDYFSLPGSKRSNLRTCKEEDDHRHHDTTGIPKDFPSFERKPPLVRSAGFPSSTTSQVRRLPHSISSSENHASSRTPSREVTGFGLGGADVLLQWGHKKRSRCSRADPSGQKTPAAKIQRRSVGGPVDKQAVAPMLPPGGGSGGYSRGYNLRPCAPVPDPAGVISNSWTTEERSSGLSRPEKCSPPTPAEKMPKAAALTINGGPSAQPDSANPASTMSSLHEAAGGIPITAEKLDLDLFEWPKIYVSLCRKEKEDDFLAMKGTKLPQRPKKRAKNIDKVLQYCFPGMWLSDLTRGRYEVREKKCMKKKRRGLKGMEKSLDSDSD